MNSKIKEYLVENIEKTVRYTPESEGTLLGLPYRYTTPCAVGTFKDLYYWDTYFTNVGLLIWDKTEYAKSNIENMFYLIDKYGFMPNGNRTGFLNRSQPPFLSQMVRDLYDNTRDIDWLKHAYEELKKEYKFWQTKRITPNGLNAYTGYEVLERNFPNDYHSFLKRTGYKPDCEEGYELYKKIYFASVSVCESGWDCNSRVKEDGYYFNVIDLNSLIYGIEENMRYFSTVLENGEEDLWEQRIKDRREKMQLLWNSDRNLFMDYNYATNKFSNYASAASFYPMYVKLATKEQAEQTMKLFDTLNLEYGISCGEPNPEWNCQWDYPNVWAPIQFIVYKALMNYGYEKEAKNVARKFVDLLEKNFELTGNLWEKYDGNKGLKTDLEYKAPPMVGWTAGVYIFFNKELGLI